MLPYAFPFVILFLLTLLLSSAPISLISFPRQAPGGAILITGTSSGIGRSAAIALCARGFVVVATIRQHTPEVLETFRKDAAARGCLASNLHFIRMQVTNATERSLAIEYLSKLSPVVAIINNAGVSQDLPLELLSESAIRHVIEVNFFAPMLLIREAIPLIKRSKGRIITVGSLAGRLAAPGQAIYAASKHALDGAHDSLRRELLEFGVSVSMIDPACVQSAIFSKSVLDADPSASLSQTDYDKYRRHFERRNKLLYWCEYFAADPEHSTSADIIHAVMDSRPKARYFSGTYTILSGRALSWLAWILPERVLDLATSDQWPGTFT